MFLDISQFSSPPTKSTFFSHFLAFSLYPNMIFTTLKSPIITPPPPPFSSKRHRFNHLSVKCICDVTNNTFPDKLRRLVSEFRSLPEPIDRVKRLLHHASTLPHLGDSIRSESNRVRGCTTQVWVEVRLDEFGKMRFKADSDSEITKGFVSCLVWLLDGAEPGEVLSIAADDLRGMNVGVHGKEMSRVNTWHNVLYAMQSRTRCLIEELEPPFAAAFGGGDTIRIQHTRC